jgi:hypothetical protein
VWIYKLIQKDVNNLLATHRIRPEKHGHLGATNNQPSISHDEHTRGFVFVNW